MEPSFTKTWLLLRSSNGTNALLSSNNEKTLVLEHMSRILERIVKRRMSIAYGTVVDEDIGAAV